MMTKKEIKLSRIEDVRKLVSTAGKCDFDINVFYNRIVVDAKSILGVMSLDLSRPLTVEYNGYDAGFEGVLAQFAVASV